MNRTRPVSISAGFASDDDTVVNSGGAAAGVGMKGLNAHGGAIQRCNENEGWLDDTFVRSAGSRRHFPEDIEGELLSSTRPNHAVCFHPASHTTSKQLRRSKWMQSPPELCYYRVSCVRSPISCHFDQLHRVRVARKRLAPDGPHKLLCFVAVSAVEEDF